MADRLMGAVSLCRKAGKLRMGMDLVCEEVQKGSVRLVLVADGVSERSERKVREAWRAARQQGVDPMDIEETCVPIPRR